MVDFRRGITALAGLALFAGLASAQVITQGQLTCNPNVATTPNLRAEGFKELTGDIQITCNGGSVIAVGQQIPAVNITIFYNAPVTSRLFGSAGAGGTASEALLLIDEPGSAVGGFGTTLPQVACATPFNACPAFVGFPVNPVSGAASPTAGMVTAVGGTTPAPNVYQGVVNGNSVTFFGVPILPPTTTGSRVFRITDVRINANTLPGGSSSGATPVSTSILISPSNALGIQNAIPPVGFVTAGLNASASGVVNETQCNSLSKAAVSTLSFAENFATAFKTRVDALNINTAGAGQFRTVGLTQTIPGKPYNSESGLVFAGIANGTVLAGLADFGTRLKATFNNIPSGATIFVSVTNVSNDSLAVTPPAVPGGSAANSLATGFAQLVSIGSTETTSDDSGGVLGINPIASTTTANGVAVAPVSIVNGTGSAVWEVVNTNPNAVETLKFSVYLTFTANTQLNTPLPGLSTVNLSFAPVAASAAASTTIPAFTGDATTAGRNIFNITVCRTVLLYPFITNQAGFDTGLTVANTSVDPFSTPTQTGNCLLKFFGGSTALPTGPIPDIDTGIIKPGTVYTTVLSSPAPLGSPNFQGYMFAVCNFQFAHGFAFISDVGARNIAMGYLAVVLDDPAASSNGSRANKNTTNTENGGH